MKELKTKFTKKHSLYLLVVVMVIASIAYRLTINFNIEQTSILFIGLPALITIIMIKYTKTPKSAYGVVFYVITVFLLLSSILLGEGIICIIMAAPLFYGVAALLVSIFLFFNKKNKSNLYSLVAVPVLIIIGQPLNFMSNKKLQTVTTSVIVNSNVKLSNFNKIPIMSSNLPTFFKMGFPTPIAVLGKGVDVGNQREIQFESTTKGVGSLVLEIGTKSTNELTFIVKSDDTHIDHWLTWEGMTISLVKLKGNKTEITWTSNYYCDLGPTWYFEYIEQYAVDLMNKHLIDAYFN